MRGVDSSSRPLPFASARQLLFGCTAVVALPFIAVGVLIIRDIDWRAESTTGAIVQVVAGAFFAGTGLFMLALVWWGLRKAAVVGLTVAEEPGRPWLWHEDWAEGVLRDRPGTAAPALWFVAVSWNLISVLLLIVIVREISAGESAIVLLTAFPLIGAGLLAAAIYQTVRRVKYGATVCRIDPIPVAPGQKFHGTIETHVTEPPRDGFTLRLACVRRRTTEGESNETVLWEERQIVPSALAAPLPGGMHVPFAFAVPADAEPTEERNPADAIIWRLEVGAAMRRINYRARFEVPVFSTQLRTVSTS